jgi:hypothetical protein
LFDLLPLSDVGAISHRRFTSSFPSKTKALFNIRHITGSVCGAATEHAKQTIFVPSNQCGDSFSADQRPNSQQQQALFGHSLQSTAPNQGGHPFLIFNTQIHNNNTNSL